MKEIRVLIPIAALLLFIASLGAYALFNQAEEELIISYLFPPDWYHARSLDELVARSTDIVRVKVLTDEWYKDGVNGSIFTMNPVRVTEVFKGNTQVDDIIDIAQRGGRRGNVMLVLRDRIDLEPGDDLVLFLRLMSPSAFNRENVFSFPAQFQSVHRFPALSEEGSIATFTFDEELELESITGRRPGAALTLTVGDLKRIANESFGPVPE